MTASSPETILKSLNKAQRRAVTSKSATVAILAGPGSGKTHTLTSRVVWLVQQAGHLPADIIVATFTVKAAREMKERIGERLGKECEKKIVLGTFHSIARMYLAVYGKCIGLDSRFGIADDGDSRAILQRIIKRHDLQLDVYHARSWISKKKSKSLAVTPKHGGKPTKENPALHTCFEEYQAHLARANLLDYDDLLVKCVELLQTHPSCVKNVQAVLIDEYQDTNSIQYDLMRLFAQARQRITIVGDPDQSIYGWRSAEIKNLYRFLRDFPDTDEIALEENYRSSQHILDMSLRVIQQDNKRYQKVLLPVHSKGSKPVLRKLKSSSVEGQWIVSELRRVTTMFGGALKNDDVAILLRSASLSRHIEAALGKAGILYRMIGGHKFYDRKEIKIILDYLRVIHQPENNDTVARVINVPRRGIGETTIKSLLEEAEKGGISLWALLWRHCRGGRSASTKIRPNMEQKLNTDFLRTVSMLRQRAGQICADGDFTLVDLIEQLVKQFNLQKYMETEYPEDYEQRWANIQELVSLAGDFMRDYSQSDDEVLPTIADVAQDKEDDILGRFLANVALASDAQSGGVEQEKRGQVTISTIHASKGLEWPVVFVPSVYEGSIPHSRAEDMDEERRLLYVAMTRAKALLYLSCPLYGAQGLSSKVELSPFVSSFAGTFGQKGPSFDRPLVDSVGRILSRTIPSEKSIFDQMPAMFCPEDDQLPIDPFDHKASEVLDPEGEGHQSRPSKKPRTAYAKGNDTVQQRVWKSDYATTMEQSSTFTMSSLLPGFISAGAHQTTLERAGSEAAASRQRDSKVRYKRSTQAGTTKRHADQRSLLGFLTTGPESTIANPIGKSMPVVSPSSPHQTCKTNVSRVHNRHIMSPKLDVSNDTQHVIDPEFAQHKIIRGNFMTRSDYVKTQTRAYPCGKVNDCLSPSLEPPPDPAKSQLIKDDVSQRPATSFHSTTFTRLNPVAGVRRSVGLGPPPTLDRLRKPFKPLTINRPGRPTRDSI